MAFAGNVMFEKLYISNMYYCFFWKKKGKMISWGYAWFGWISKLIVWCVVKEAISPPCWFFLLLHFRGVARISFRGTHNSPNHFAAPPTPPPQKKLPWWKIWLRCNRLRVSFCIRNDISNLWNTFREFGPLTDACQSSIIQ